jgi:hypothetical protein
MNTSANTNQARGTTTSAPRTTPSGFRRRTMAGALVIMAITATAVGLAATSHADPGAPAPNPHTTAPVPDAWLPTIDRFGPYWRPYCSPHWGGRWHCLGF